MRKPKTSSILTSTPSATGNYFRHHQSNFAQSSATLPPPSSSSLSMRTTTVRFRGLGSTLEEEADELMESSNSVPTAAPDEAPTPTNGGGRESNGRRPSGALMMPSDGSSTVTSRSGNGSCPQRDHSAGGSPIVASTELAMPDDSLCLPAPPAAVLLQQQQQLSVRTGRSGGGGGVMSSCLHGSRSATVQPTAGVVPTASRSFDV